ncbi:MAG: response regulator [Clostridia bacterium]|nr:response regulator [Clostridia bacterium]
MKKVLVVDDTKNIRTLLTTCLEIEGFEVLTANDGKQALALFENQTFDLAFLDIKMPEVSGTEVLRRIREMGIHTPVIIITAFATVKNAIDCTKMGAVAYIQKPFTADKIRAVISEITSEAFPKVSTPEICLSTHSAEALVEQGSFRQAVELLKKALSADPTNPDTYHLLGKSYDGLGEKELADKFYQTAQLFKAR